MQQILQFQMITAILLAGCFLLTAVFGIKSSVAVLFVLLLLVFSLSNQRYRVPALVISTSLSASKIGLNLGLFSAGHIATLLLLTVWLIDEILGTGPKILVSNIFVALTFINLLNFLSFYKMLDLRHWLFPSFDFLCSSFICFAVANTIRNVSWIESTLITAIWTGLVVALIGIWQFIVLGIDRVYSIIGLGQYNTLAGYLMLIIPITLAGYFCFKDRTKKKYFLIANIVMVICLLMTQSRGGVFALLTVFGLFLTINYGNDKKQIIKIIWVYVSISILIWLISSVLFPIFTTMITLRIQSVGTHDLAMWGRVRLYYAAYNMFRQYPLLGIGIGNYVLSYHKYGAIGIIPYIYSSAHNIYLQVLCEQGIIGFSMFFSVLFWVLRRLWKRLRGIENETLRWWYLSLLGSICGIFIHGFVDSLFHFRPFSFLFWILIGLFLAMEKICFGDNKMLKISLL